MSDRGADDRERVLPAFNDDPAAAPPSHRTIEAGSPKIEHVIFVLVGVIGTIVVFLRGLGLL